MNDLIYSYTGRVVIYTDGSCRRNGRRGAAAGYGVVFNFDHPW